MLYWISFAADDGFLGVAIVEAPSPEEATREARRRGINPGGEALVFDIHERHQDQARPYRNRLLKREEMERVFGPLRTTKNSVEARDAVSKAASNGRASLICEKCNEGVPHSH